MVKDIPYINNAGNIFTNAGNDKRGQYDKIGDSKYGEHPDSYDGTDIACLSRVHVAT